VSVDYIVQIKSGYLQVVTRTLLDYIRDISFINNLIVLIYYKD
jgi:hypothetical protein